MSHVLAPSILREYDIRGPVGEALGETDAHAVGRSFGTLIRRSGGHCVAVGRDGRLSSPALEAALVTGLQSTGTDVVRIGLGPSPMLYFAEATLPVDGGIHVTASHNPKHHNGFKMVLGHRSFWGGHIQDLAAIAAAGDWATGEGKVSEAAVLPAYVARLMQGYGGGTFRIGWDCGNGASGPAVDALTAILPGEHHLLYTEPDGNFPYHHPDPAEAANLADLQALVVRERLDFGVAFDGDGDRIGVICGRGRVLWGDQILAILAEPLLRELPGATIIADVKASDALFGRVAALGGVPCMWKTGHSAIKSKMLQMGAPLAGEMSGHIFFGQDFYGHDDALYAAVRLIRAVHLSGRSLTELVDFLPQFVTTPDLRITVPEHRKSAVVDEVLKRLMGEGADLDRTDGARVRTADGWWLLRASNTQGALTVRAEAADQAGLDRLLAAVDRQLAASGIQR